MKSAHLHTWRANDIGFAVAKATKYGLPFAIQMLTYTYMHIYMKKNIYPNLYVEIVVGYVGRMNCYSFIP